MAMTMQDHQTVVRFLRVLLKHLAKRLTTEELAPYTDVVDKYEKHGTLGFTSSEEIEKYNQLLEHAKLI